MSDKKAYTDEQVRLDANEAMLRSLGFVLFTINENNTISRVMAYKNLSPQLIEVLEEVRMMPYETFEMITKK